MTDMNTTSSIDHDPYCYRCDRGSFEDGLCVVHLLEDLDAYPDEYQDAEKCASDDALYERIMNSDALKKEREQWKRRCG